MAAVHTEDLIKLDRNGSLNLVAIGRTGDGKSSTLNSILAHSNVAATFVPFVSCEGANSVTKVFSHRLVEIFGLDCRLIDTMGLFDTDLTPDSNNKHSASLHFVPDMDDDHKLVLSQLSKVIQLCSDGVDAFLFVVSGVGRFTKESKDTIKIILRFFGNSMLDHCIFILTNKDRIKSPKELRIATQAVSEFLVKCGCSPPAESQFVAFDNYTNPRPIEQVEELVAAIRSLQQRHNGQPYKNAAFVAAQEELERQKAELIREKQRQVEEVVAKETDKIAQFYQEQNETVRREIEAREEAMKSANEEVKRESQRQIDQLMMQMQLNREKAEKERDERIAEVQNEAKRVSEAEMRKLQEMMTTQQTIANEKITNALREMEKHSKSQCAIL